MTPAEQARALFDRFDWMAASESRGVDMAPELLALKADVASALSREEQVRAEERERCARIADDNRTDDDSLWDRAAATIAAAIRSAPPSIASGQGERDG